METYEVMFIHEIKDLHLWKNVEKRAFKFTGRMVFHDPILRYCQIEDRGNYLVVDLSLVDMSCLKLNHLVQIFGKLESYPNGNGKIFPECKDKHYISAKIIHAVEGLDMNLFKEVTALRRRFLQTS